MTLPTPPRYVVLPEEVIEQAYAPDKPRRALLASFTRILSLAWESKYQHTPPLDELELMAFLKLSRRQYYEQMADMALIGWLRSSHPRPGFVQFSFSRSIADKVVPEPSAENRTASAEIPLVVGGDSESNLNSDSTPSTPPQEASAENRTGYVSVPNITEILRYTHLLFDGSVVSSRGLVNRPLEALAWCAYAYDQKHKLDAPAGLVRKRLQENEPAPLWTTEQWAAILPVNFLEVLGLVAYECEICQAKFKKQVEFDEHVATHPRRFKCPHCDQVFDQEIDLDSHIAEEHEPKAIPVDESVRVPIHGRLTAEQAWQSALDQLQMEVPRASFDAYVRGTKIVRYDRNTLTIGTRGSYARDWLESRLASTVCRLLVGILAADVAVEFVVAQLEDA